MAKPLILLFILLNPFFEFDNKSDPAESLEVDLQYSSQALGVNFVIRTSGNHPVRIRFRNRDREVVFEQSFYGAKIYKGTFDLKNLPSGMYFIEVRHSHHKIVKELQLKKTSLRTVQLY